MVEGTLLTVRKPTAETDMGLDENGVGSNPSGGIVAELITQEILRHPEQLAQSFMNAPNVGVGICDLQFRFRGINDALADINGIPTTAHFGQTIYDILGDFAGKIAPLFNHVIASGEPVLNMHLTGVLPTRKEPGHWIENYFPLKDERGHVTRLCSMVIEVTEQKKLEQSFQLLSGICLDGTNQLKTLMEFHKQLIAKPDPGAIAGAITGFVNRVIPHDYALLTLEDDTMRWLGMDPKDIVGVEGWDWKGSMSSRITNSGVEQTRLVEVGSSQSRQHTSGWEQVLQQGIESAYSMPLVSQRGKLGTLHLASRQAGAFQGLDREVVEQVAMHVALAVDYACSSKEIESLKNRMTEPTISVRRAEPERMPGTGSAERTLAMVERDYILQVLRQTGGKVAGARGAAAKLGMKRTTLQSRMLKLKIQRNEYVSAGKDLSRLQAV